jgi:hypothetical protein
VDGSVFKQVWPSGHFYHISDGMSETRAQITQVSAVWFERSAKQDYRSAEFKVAIALVNG